jgi:hypothetical protein
MWTVIVRNTKGLVGRKEYPSRRLAAESLRSHQTSYIYRNQEEQVYFVMVAG